MRINPNLGKNFLNLIHKVKNHIYNSRVVETPYTHRLEPIRYDDRPHKLFITPRENTIIELSKLDEIIPDDVLRNLPLVVEDWDITIPYRMSHFLGQIMHESADFRFVTENLNYSKEGLLTIFSKYFTPQQAEQYARKPIAIASRVYGNRMGNGNEASQEGWKYRGRGYIQLTGKNNYRAFSQEVGVDFVENPDLVATPKYALLSAAWFFTKNNIHLIADDGIELNIIRRVTRAINGGYNGLEDRINKTNQIYNLLK